MNKIELLSPAGNFECLKAAINNGADAIYLGGNNFSARAFADNFDHQEIIEAIKYAHLRNVKIFITVNTLLNDYQIINAIKECDFYYENNVDALIIQDLGLYYILKDKYPDFELHCSTQMHVHNISGIKNAKSLGFSRVVIPRESNIDFIKEACKQDIEIECFVHGAICSCYSGECLLSSISQNRSANKGMCSGSCRMAYTLLEDSKEINTDGKYLLSSKDLFYLNDIPALIDAGVKSFKIEGRMKSPAYVAYITRIYREAIDAYLNNEEFKITDEIVNNMKVLFNREYFNGYLNDGLNDMYNPERPNHKGILIGKVINYNKGFLDIKLNKKLNQFDGIRIVDKNKEDGFILNYLYKEGKLVSSVDENEIANIKSNQSFSIGSLVYKTYDYIFENELLNYEEKKIPISLDINLYVDKETEIIINVDNKEYKYIDNIKSQEAINSPLQKDDIIKQFSKTGDSIYKIRDININCDNIFLPKSKLNEIRRNLINYLDKERLNSFKRIIYPREIELSNNLIQEKGKIIIENGNDLDAINIKNISPINLEEKYEDVIADIGGLLIDNNKKIAYPTLNISNSFAYEFLIRLGFKHIILSYELNKDEIDKLIDSYKDRNNIDIYPHEFYSGRRNLMYLKINPIEKYQKDNHKYYLKSGVITCELLKEKGIFVLKEDKSDINDEFNDKCTKFIIK